MNRSNHDALLAQILPILTNPKAFQSFIDQAPLTKEEKTTLSQIFKQFNNPQAAGNSIQAINKVIQSLMSRSNPEQLNSLAPLLEQISKMSPENLKTLQKLLGI